MQREKVFCGIIPLLCDPFSFFVLKTPKVTRRHEYKNNRMIHCTLPNASLFLKVLQTVSIARESWTSCIFTRDVLVLHTAGDDQSSTATATVPKSLFGEYAVAGECRFMVHVNALTDALLIGGPQALYSTAVSFRMSFPTSDGGRLLVELDDSKGCRCLQSKIVTRPVKERLLDLRFSESLITNRVTLRGDAVVELLHDLTGFQAAQTRFEFSPTHFKLIGLESSFGSCLEIAVPKTSDVVIGLEVGDVTVKPKYHTHHLAAACGVGTSSSSRGAFRSADSGNSFDPASMWGSGASSFERLTLAVNGERQLSVTHQGLDHTVPVMVNVVLSPICDLMEM